MNKIVLSALAALTLGSVAASAGDVKFYQDRDGQVFTTPAEGRAEIKSDTPTFAKASKLQFSGVHYLGYNYKSMEQGKSTGNFEMRRNYVQTKAYVLDDPKSYLRVTLDATYSDDKQAVSGSNYDGYSKVYVKYAYLYLNDILPSTGMEFGMVHRPWIDYEEHQGWWMRSISKVFVEASEAGKLTNSADLGFNLKTKTPYFTSELGLFNGEGYHGQNDAGGLVDDPALGDGLSAEWRLTAAMLGNGEKKRKPLKDSYFDASFFGQHNMENSANAAATGVAQDYTWYGLHTVYNNPNFLIAAQYVNSDNDLANNSNWNGSGYSVNTTIRFGENKQYSVIGRYDKWENENSTTNVVTQTEENYIYGVAWQQNKNVKWLLSGQTYDRKETDSSDYTSAMLTAEVHW